MTPSTRVHRLACGMPLLLHENHDVAVATADIWVRTGAADEPDELSGVSHFLEHMLFKGAGRFGLGEIERMVEAVGGVCNAATSYDFTHYYVTLPSAALPTGLEMLSEMVRNATLDAAELEKERLVILEEYRRKQDHPAGVLYETLYGEFFESGPYHNTVLGSEATIRAIDRPGMLDYFQRRYSPENMVLVIAGDIDQDAAIARAEALLGDFPRPLVEVRPDPPLRRGAAKRRHLAKPTGGELYVAWALPAPGMDRPDAVVPLDVAQFILGQGRAAVLYQSLKEKQQLCSSIGSYFPTHLRDSFFLLTATCLPEQLDPLRQALLAELRAFAAADPDERALGRARRLLASSHRFSMETTGGATSNLGYYYTMTGGVEFIDGYLERLERTTAAEVREAFVAVHPEALEEHLVEISVGPGE